MKDVMKYNGFFATVHYSADDELLFGKIEGIEDLVTFEGDNIRDLKIAFHEAVDDYVEICNAHDKPLFKSYKGSFNVRLSKELHRQANEAALTRGISLNQFVQTALEHEIAGD